MIRILFVLAVLAVAAPAAGADDVPAELLQDVPGGRIERPRIVVTGSETMTPFTEAIAQRLADRWKVSAPEERPSGTHAGFVKFCEGVGAEYPDIVAATRRMRQAELDACVERGVVDIIEVPIGYSAVAFVQRKGDVPIRLSPKAIYQALAAEAPQGQDLAANPFQRWKQIDKKLPDDEIRVLLPGSATGTRNFFDDMFMQGGCRKFSVIRLTFDDRDRVRLCVTTRADGRMVEMTAGYDDLLPRALLDSPPGTIGILPYFVALARADTLQILPVNDVMPSARTIADDSYEGVHVLYYYVKRAHMLNHEGHGVVHNLRRFIVEATSEEARASGGYLEALGLVPIPADERLKERRSALRLERFER